MNLSEGNAKTVRDDIYLKIWQTEQDIINRRWMTTSFFLTVSFALFSFTVKQEPDPSAAFDPNILLVPRIVAVVLYWFALVLFFQFTRYTDYLRRYLRRMEEEGETSLTLETRAHGVMRGKWARFTVTRWLLVYFGILYTCAVLVLWFLRM
jgi:hypothetical protein